MESYIVRIYRRDDKTPSRLAGILEELMEDRVNVFRFHTAEELVEIITGRNARNGKGRGTGKDIEEEERR